MGLLFLVDLLAAVGLALTRLVNVSIQPFALTLANAAALGLLAGFTSRHALRAYTSTLRLAASLAAVIVALIFLGRISLGATGVVVTDPSRQRADWMGLAQALLGGSAVSLALNAWRRSRPSPDSNGEMTHSEIVQPLPLPELAPRRQPGPRLRLPAAPRRRPWGSRPALRRQLRVRLVGREEHRCPYCLELVRRRDSRGVVVCRVCHTRHHADCWGVTGACQVPHHHE